MRKPEDVEGREFDLLIVGGGINGAGIARDAAGRGLSVLLVEKDDLASHTSSASTKLIHGGLRYLEHGEFRLVREALIERERLLAIAPHIIEPMNFLLPRVAGMRPGWMIRLGLFLYDHLGRRGKLARSRAVSLKGPPYGNGLRTEVASRGFLYSDCRVDDSRLVILNALDAHEHGATVMTRTRLVSASRDGAGWAALLDRDGRKMRVRARTLVNAAGPWTAELLTHIEGTRFISTIRLVKGSHIVVPRLYEGEHCFLLQNPDGRVVFAIPYEDRFTLVGTTEELWSEPLGPARISAAETDYLLATIRRYFTAAPEADAVVWSYAGIRALYDDHAADASAITRDYVLEVDGDAERAPILSIFGGKITTYRRLAEEALGKLAAWLPMGAPWTGGSPLPGGDLEDGSRDRLLTALIAACPGLPEEVLRRYVRTYGTRTLDMLGTARAPDAMGEHFGQGLHAVEVDYLVDREWARTAEDILFRRTRLGLHMPEEGKARLDAYLARRWKEAG